MKLLLTGNEAAAWACKLSKPQTAPTYPITPQTITIETLEAWKAKGELPDTDVVQMESEHSVMSFCIAASATGSRVFTATSSQGLLLMHEMLYIASGLRLPIVMVNVSRAISAPISLWPDHQDFLDCRDTGWIMMHCKNVQEVLDFTIMAYKIGEHPDVLLPVLVNQDGYTLSFTEEPVDIPDQLDIDNFLGTYQSDHNISPEHKLGVGAPCMADYYAEFKIQQCLAMENSRQVIKDVFAEFGKLTGRFYSVVDYLPAKSETEIILVSQGSMSTTVRYVCKQHDTIGHLNLNLIRPFPADEVSSCLMPGKKIGVIDRNIMPGSGGIICPEIKQALYRSFISPEVYNIIIGLGGKPITEHRINVLINKILTTKPGLEFMDADL